jgi:ABC-type protease/lipase transport system fused ATPase/permease subunit
MDPEVNNLEEKPTEEQVFSGGDIQADQVSAQGMINQITANHVSIHDGAVLMVQSGSMDVTDGGIGFARAEQVVFQDGSAGMLVANVVTGENIGANLMISREVQATVIKTSVLLAGRIDGPVETKVDARGALFAGLAAGAGMGVVLAVARLLTKRLQN